MVKLFVIACIVICVVTGVLSFVLGISKGKPGLLYLLVLPIAIITLPIKLAIDMLGGGRRRK